MKARSPGSAQKGVLTHPEGADTKEVAMGYSNWPGSVAVPGGILLLDSFITAVRYVWLCCGLQIRYMHEI